MIAYNNLVGLFAETVPRHLLSFFKVPASAGVGMASENGPHLTQHLGLTMILNGQLQHHVYLNCLEGQRKAK